ncbi:hypothetical protein [Romboutsia sp.]|uniref:hypothetical protein n=1 Tax=Romboutsia sp. TaxID=1965302 RepID=UPI002D7E3218|nr:hypothetical protein [Romboutsia sp.]
MDCCDCGIAICSKYALVNSLGLALGSPISGMIGDKTGAILVIRYIYDLVKIIIKCFF